MRAEYFRVSQKTANASRTAWSSSTTSTETICYRGDVFAVAGSDTKVVYSSYSGAGAATVAPCSATAHSPQNFAVGRLAVPHEGQTWARRAAHSMQNFVPGGLSVPQFEQTTLCSDAT